jgi:hypothetical protein
MSLVKTALPSTQLLIALGLKACKTFFTAIIQENLVSVVVVVVSNQSLRKKKNFYFTVYIICIIVHIQCEAIKPQ